MPNRFRRPAFAGALCALALTNSACGGGGGDAGASSDGPVTVSFWGWANGHEALVDAFNASHDDIRIEYAKGTDATTMMQQLTNAFEAGDAPCLFQNSSEFVPSFLSDGMLADVTEYVEPHRDEFIESAYLGATVQGTAYGVPTSSAPAFTIYRADVFEEYGLQPPETWDDMIEAGRVLAEDGINITNYAGEDPSTLVTMAMQAGAHWYQIEGDAWKIDLLDPGSLRAAEIIQEIVDGGMHSSLTFADYAAVQRNYDQGGTVTRQISTWQMSGMVQNFTDSLGAWALAPWPTLAGEAPRTPAGTNNSGGVNLVTSQCEYPEQAAEAALWMSTDPEAVELMASPDTGNGLMPAVTNAGDYVDQTISEDLLGENYDAARQIVIDSLDTVTTDWTFGPNWTAMSTEMADGWARVITGEQTVVQLLEYMQEWTVNDLTSRGINVVTS
ncbi:ABC transporter substrate-binding protein [Streptomyces millisiae]|uniref:Extracellular solute-binding protein n=1 Tax=Streptomyces millisiae TaxID=3075542 RepID=A0ABU2LHG5_9ACTN|nr:extracellular solute-binding protein [Streptomyces sp. DSM 44918]MDT0317035.1 extracellular solute-binding protein [Streptomyces sp. DSM 44918]